MKKILIAKLSSVALILAVLIFIVLQSCNENRAKSKLSVWEDTLTLPTYLVDSPNPMPRFYEGQTHQGVQRRMYPYPMNDNLTGIKENRDYQIIYIENEYIKVGIMPELGGRVYEAVDKTNGYNYFYRNDVIKPSLIGMVGFWISGSNAWGYPHHHGPHTVEPMDYIIENYPDGSVTIWMAYTELFHRMRILFGWTVYPNSSILEMTIRPYNPTPILNSFLFWANPSVHADTNYQVIFPPSVEYVTQHHKREMTTWPIADRYYNRYDYAGKDISMWKNTGVPSSFFSWKPTEDFFGGYDHGKQAGTAWIGNHHTMPGMKYWADGNNPAGEMINNGLTDNSGRYIELMAGAFTDNQPDYSWLQPYESKDVLMTWYPIRLLGGLIEANKNAALNLVVEGDGNVSIRLNTTRLIKNSKLVLLYNGEEVFRESFEISPAKPYNKNVFIGGQIIKENLKITLFDSSDQIIIEHKPKPLPGNPMPEPLEPPPSPKDVKTIEELYLHGLRLDQFYNASISSYPYYYEALNRDPEDYNVNTQLGILYIKRKMFEEAEKHLQTAVDRITMRYTRPKDSEALYYLGVAQRRLNKNKEAYDNFYAASWNSGWHTQSFHQLAELDCKNGHYDTALDHINRAISTNANNIKALSLKVIILRKIGMIKDAEILAKSIIEKDLLHYQSKNELYLIHKLLNQKKQAEVIFQDLSEIMRDRIQPYLEFASEYANCGFYEEAIEILTRIEKKGEQFPMLYYHLGYYWSMLNEIDEAKKYFSAASLKPHTYCFPFRDESIDALNEALAYFPIDAMAYYYLGNLFYELQPEKAIKMWEKSVTLNSKFYIVHRNLAWAAQEKNDMKKAVEYYGKAFSNNNEDTRLMYEYDLTLMRAGVAPYIRYENIFKGNRHISEKQSATYLRELELLTFLKKYDEVINIITQVGFVESEGSQVFRDVFHNVYILRSMQRADAGNYEDAILDMQAAIDFPIGRWGSERRAEMYYQLGTYYEKYGNELAAENSYKKAISEIVDDSEYLFHKGLAYKKLKQSEKSLEQFNSLLELANRRADFDAFRSFEAGAVGSIQQAQNHYMRGLAYHGMNRKNDAQLEFMKALKLNPAHLWANYMLSHQ